MKRFLAGFVLAAMLFTNVMPVSLALAEDASTTPEEVVDESTFIEEVSELFESDPIVYEAPEEEVTEVAEEVADAPTEESLEEPVEEAVVEESTEDVADEEPSMAAPAPELTTDKDDYAPGSTATIWGRFFGAFQRVALTIIGLDDSGAAVVTDSWEVEADDAGAFTTFYNLINQYVPLYLLAANSETGELLTETSFTDSIVGSVAVTTSQNPNPLTAGNAATFGLTVTYTGNANLCTVNVTTSGLPVGATSNPLSVTGNSSMTGTLTINTLGSLANGSYPFTITATNTGNCQNLNNPASVSATLVVGTTKSNQTIMVTTPAPANATYGNTFNVAATASSLLPVTITTSGACSGGDTDGTATITIESGSGTCTVSYNQMGNGSFNPAPQVQENTTAQKRSVTPSITADDKEYDGTDDATASCDLTGELVGDDVTCSVGDASFNNANVGTGKTVTATGITLGGADAGNYMLTTTSDTDTADITAREIEVTADASQSKVYGDADPLPFTYTITDGSLVAPDTFSGALSRVAGEDAGFYAMTQGTLALSANYDLTFVSNDFEIVAASSVTIITCPASVVYDGTAQEPCTAEVTGVGLSESLPVTYSDNIDAGTATAEAEFLGDANHEPSDDSTTFEIEQADSVTDVVCPVSVVYNGTAQEPCTVSVTGAGGLSLTPDADYTDNTNAGTASASYTYPGDANHTGSSDSETFEIEKADPVCTILGYNDIYDGAAHGATGSCTGVLGEDLSGDLDLGGSFTDVPGGIATWTFTDTTGNYNDDSDSVDIIIEKADAVIIVDPYDVIYDGDPHTSTGSATGVLGEDLSGDLDLSDTTHTNAGDYTGDAWTFTDTTGNYNDDAGTVDNNIDKADAVINVTPYDVVYDGDPHTSLGSATGVKGEDLSADLDLSGTTHTNAGTYTDDPWVFTDTTGNYNDANGTVDNEIDQADANVTVEGFTGVYDGLPHGATGSATGVDGEDLSSGLDLGLTFIDVPGGTAFWTFEGGTNYLDEDGSVEIVIEKADPVCTVTPYSVTYDGDAHTAEGECLGVLDEVLTGLDLSGTTHTDAGVYNDTWTFTDVTGNYNDDSDTIVDTIGQKELTITAENKSKQYSDPLPAFTVSYSGFVDGEDETNLAGTLVCGTTATMFSASGTYPISCSGLTSDNYDIEYVNGVLKVNRENVAILYTGDTNIFTAGPTIMTAVAQLSAALTEENDSYPGDLSLAKVDFILDPQGPGNNIVVANVPVNAGGIALTNAQVPVGVYDITVIVNIGNLYWEQNQVGADILVVDQGTNDQRVTGGGWVLDAASLNDKDNVGFTVYYNKTGAPKGNFLFMYRGEDGYNYKIKNNSWAKGGLSFSGTNAAYFTGKATLEKIDQETGQVVSSDGSYSFAVNLKDGDKVKPVIPDTIAITIFDGSKNIWKQLGTAASQLNLGGGNVTVHSK